jgi:hypothetical protein
LEDVSGEQSQYQPPHVDFKVWFSSHMGIASGPRELPWNCHHAKVLTIRPPEPELSNLPSITVTAVPEIENEEIPPKHRIGLFRR